MKTRHRFGFGAWTLPAGCLVSALALACPAAAQVPPSITYTVTVVTDAKDAVPGDGFCAAVGGACTLRAAVEENEAQHGGGTILLPAGEFRLTLGELLVTTNLIINGAGSEISVVNANGGRGFHIDGAATANFFVRMNNFDVANGVHEDAGAGRGAAIAILSNQAVVSLFRMRFYNNRTDWRGGAIDNLGELTIEDCAITDNVLPFRLGIGVTGSGAGIYNEGLLGIYMSTIARNSATRGAGIFNTGRMTMQNCTLYGNKVNLRGGAIFNESSPTNQGTITYSTITNNQTGFPVAGQTPPSANINGGGIYNNGILNMATTILAENVDPNNTLANDDSPDCYSNPDDRVSAMPTFVSFRDNIIGKLDPAACNIRDQSSGAPSPFDFFGSPAAPLDPLLFTQNVNGGVGSTREPMPNSPAIEHAVKGPGTVFPCPEIDQRGAPRPVLNSQLTGPGCTLGAYQAAVPTTFSIEAENAMRVGASFPVADNTASGGQYVAFPATAANQTTVPNEGQKLIFEFYVDQGGNYQFRGTVKTSSGDHNSFWVKVGGLPTAGYLWDLPVSPNGYVTDIVGDRGTGTEANPQFATLDFNLSRGVVVVEVYLRENGAQLDKLELVQTGALFSMETETASLTGAFMVGLDPLASAGQYVFTSTAVNFLSAPDANHVATSVLNAPTAGTYLLKGHVHAQADASNSFWVKVDGLPANGYLWDMTEDNLTYGPDYLSDRGNGNSANPQVDAVELNLTAGPHTIEVFAREGGTRLDNLALETKAAADARIVSRNKTYFSSSNESGSFPPAKAFDGNRTTRWSSQFSDNQSIKVDLQSTYDIDRVVLDWENAYATEYSIQISNDAENWTTLFHKDGNTGGLDNIMLTGRGRYVRMLGIHRATQSGFSLYEFTVYGAPAAGGNVNLCAGMPVTTSSNENSSFPGSKAVDQNLSTRWSSGFSDNQWIYVDLGARLELTRVKLRWEAAYGREYEIKVSDDASNWTTLFSTTAGNGGLDDLSVSGRGRYVKMHGNKRATGAGYSLFEFEAFGK